MTYRMDLQILGPLQVLVEAGPVPLGDTKQCALRAFLLLDAGRVVSSAWLIDVQAGGR